MANHLADSTSPYLLQHQDNPVDWWEWSPEALALAQELDRPILLSVGYAACPWWHVSSLTSNCRELPALQQVPVSACDGV